jgi:transitional endoplasmic reticulum ATPase
MQTEELILVKGHAFRKMTLSPAQQVAAEGIVKGIATGDVVVLRGEPGSGKTTVLRTIHEQSGGAFVGMSEFMKVLTRESASIEEAFLDLMTETLGRHELVIMDDLHLLMDVVDSCNYPREHLLNAALISLLAEARSKGKKLIFAAGDDAPWPVRRRAYCWEIGSFSPADYASICRVYLEAEVADGLDFVQIHRFAPVLNAHQLTNASVWLRREQVVHTDRFIEYLRSQDLTSNVEIEEVAKVDWNDLKGVDEVIRALETKIALPFENDALAAEFGLKPKRGVLLAGPPGTGKTTVGRALAHRLRSKFFLIDGTVIAGSRDFFGNIRSVFEAARRNAPSVIFIDDADVIFEGEGERGLCRYLLTMMDGLESASAERVCVIMTAMEPCNLPAAVLRSGRVELWLEMRLPDEEAREVILRSKLSPLPAPLGNTDVAAVASASHGLTGADLKAVVEDGKLLFAYDKAHMTSLRPMEEYFLEAIATVRNNRRNYVRRKPSPVMETLKVGFRMSE